MTNPRRTPQEIIAETEAKLERLRVKQAKKDASSNPLVAPMLVELEDLRKDIREARKGLGNSPQSFNASIYKHEVWISKIEDRRADAKLVLDSAMERKKAIEDAIASVVNSLVKDTTPKDKENYA
ncbi:MAG TPA: hypothetical protein EYN67_14985 [Flavobacteriales bacterium]|nr:hypothetical protein [Flavobacteriales bacterium]